MAKSKETLDQQIAKAKEDIKQRENKMKRLLQEQKEAERKARTKRLIERGAILESLIDGAPSLDNEQIKTLLQSVLSTAAVRDKVAALFTESAAELVKATPQTQTE